MLILNDPPARPNVSNEMDNVFYDREGGCPMDAMPKLAEV